MTQARYIVPSALGDIGNPGPLKGRIRNEDRDTMRGQHLCELSEKRLVHGSFGHAGIRMHRTQEGNCASFNRHCADERIMSCINLRPIHQDDDRLGAANDRGSQRSVDLSYRSLQAGIGNKPIDCLDPVLLRGFSLRVSTKDRWPQIPAAHQCSNGNP